MENQAVAMRLAEGFAANIAVLQIGSFVVTIILALIGLVLAMRAYTVLSEARALYWQTAGIVVGTVSVDQDRVIRAARIRTARSGRKVKSNRLRGLV